MEGQTALDESSLTGESLPVSKGVGSPVFAGTINQSGSIEFKVTRLARDSTIAKLVQMVEEAQSEKANTQRWLDQAEQYYALGVIDRPGPPRTVVVVPLSLPGVPPRTPREFETLQGCLGEFRRLLPQVSQPSQTACCLSISRQVFGTGWF